MNCDDMDEIIHRQILGMRPMGPKSFEELQALRDAMLPLPSRRKATDVEEGETQKRDDVGDFFDQLESLVDKFSEKIQSEVDTARTVRATLIVNFGKDSGRKIAGIEVDEKQSTVKMLVDVLDKLVQKVGGGK